MDSTRVSGALDTGSIPVETTIFANFLSLKMFSELHSVKPILFILYMT